MNSFPTKSLSVGSTLSPISFDALVTISLAEIAIVNFHLRKIVIHNEGICNII